MRGIGRNRRARGRREEKEGWSRRGKRRKGREERIRGGRDRHVRVARLGVERVFERLVADAAEEEHGGVWLRRRASTRAAARETVAFLGAQLDAQHLRVAHSARAGEHVLECVHREAHRRVRNQLALLVATRLRSQ